MNVSRFFGPKVEKLRMYDAFLVPEPKNYECIALFLVPKPKKCECITFFGCQSRKNTNVLRFFGAKSWKCNSTTVFCSQNQKNTEIYGKREKHIPYKELHLQIDTDLPGVFFEIFCWLIFLQKAMEFAVSDLKKIFWEDSR